QGHGAALDLGGQRFGGGAGFGLVVGLGLALGARGVQRVGVRRGGQAARQQEVAGIAVRDFVDLVALADVLDVLFENDFHGSYLVLSLFGTLSDQGGRFFGALGLAVAVDFGAD